MCYTTTQYHTACQHYGAPLVHGKPCIRALTASGHKSRGCWDATDLGVESVGSLCPGCAKALLGSPSPCPSGFSSSSLLLTSGSSSEAAGDYFGLQGGLQKVGSQTSLSSMGSSAFSVNSSTRSSSSFGASVSTTKTTTMTRSGGRNLEPPNLHWRTFGGSQVSVRFKRCVSAPAG